MKKQDIRNAYTQKVTELLNQGYTIFPDTMGGSQGEIAHIDLTDGSEILRVLLYRDHCWERGVQMFKRISQSHGKISTTHDQVLTRSFKTRETHDYLCLKKDARHKLL